MRAVLDTSVLVADEFHTGGQDELAISTVSLAELHFGVLVATDENRPTRLRRLTSVERTFRPLPVDSAVATSYGRLAAAVRSAGRQPRSRQLDLLIAATAHAHDAVLLTYNLADFEGLTGLVDVRAPARG